MADKTIEKTTDTDDTMQANKVNARDAGFTGKNNVVELDGYYTERKRINDSDTHDCIHWSACLRICDRESAKMLDVSLAVAWLGCANCPNRERER